MTIADVIKSKKMLTLAQSQVLELILAKGVRAAERKQVRSVLANKFYSTGDTFPWSRFQTDSEGTYVEYTPKDVVHKNAEIGKLRKQLLEYV